MKESTFTFLGKTTDVKINIKKDLLKTIGNAKQCKVCNKLFSSEFKAVDHVIEVHNDIEAVKVVSEEKERKKADQDSKGSKCKFCGLNFKSKQETIPHLKSIHGIESTAARERSIKRI